MSKVLCAFRRCSVLLAFRFRERFTPRAGFADFLRAQGLIVNIFMWPPEPRWLSLTIVPFVKVPNCLPCPGRENSGDRLGEEPWFFGHFLYFARGRVAPPGLLFRRASERKEVWSQVRLSEA
jgi:hypothetical protein